MDETQERKLAELLLQLKRGDGSVLADIDFLIGKRLRAYANMYYSQKADVDDAVQNLLYKLYYATKNFRKKEHAYSWVIKVFKNSIITQFRKEKRENDFIKSLEQDVVTNVYHVTDEYLENYVFFNEIISQLNKQEQELLKYVIVLGLSYAETARLMFKSKSTIEYQVNKLKEKLKTMR